MKIDWQMYEEGELGPEAMRQAEEALRTDPMAKKELDGLRAFRRNVREAALSVTVPQKRLEKRLGEVVGRVELPKWRVRLSLAAAVVCAVVLALIAVDRLSQPNSLIEERREFQTAGEAVEWASEQSMIPMPMIESAKFGPLDSVHAGRGWACFDYVVSHQIVHVKVSKGAVGKAGCSVVPTDDGELFVHTKTSAVSFSRMGLLFSVESKAPVQAMLVARSLIAQFGQDAGTRQMYPAR